MKREYCSKCLWWSTEGDPATLFHCTCECHGPAGETHTSIIGRLRGDGPVQRRAGTGKQKGSKPLSGKKLSKGVRR